MFARILTCSVSLCVLLAARMAPAQVTFVTSGPYSSPIPQDLAIGDLDGDGAPDLVTANDASGVVTLRFGDGFGNFGSPDYITVGEAQSVAVGDVNGGGADIIVGGASQVAVLLGNGAGGFSSPTIFPGVNASESLALADFDGDGFTDIAAGGPTPSRSSSATARETSACPSPTLAVAGRSPSRTSTRTVPPTSPDSRTTIFPTPWSFSVTVSVGSPSRP